MGRKRKNISKTPKHNKRARSIKLSWQARKMELRPENELLTRDVIDQLQSSDNDTFEDLVIPANVEVNLPASDFDIDQPKLPSNDNDTVEELVSSDSEVRLKTNVNEHECEFTAEDDVSLNVETIITRTPNWCVKKYEKDNMNEKQCNTDTDRHTNTNIEFSVISSDEYDIINNHEISVEHGTEIITPAITGNRVVELGYVLDCALQLQYKHSQICTLGKLHTKKEIRKSGLVSTIVFGCTACTREYRFDTENPNRSISLINTGAVWGTLASGSTYSHLAELLSSMDIPTLSDKIFYKLENILGNEWKASLWKCMEAAGAKEKEHAIEIGNVCQDGTPWITVYVDGSWSKRSYGTNFNSLSGMVGIVGRHTGELLFVAVRNKFCSICTRADNTNQQALPHTCFKNWSDSAPAMESDMVVEGFNISEMMHGVRYIKFVADGDSSVFTKIKQNVSYGKDVSKIECTNHALKNYGKHLYKMKKDTQIHLAGRKLLTKSKIALLTKRAKCSIYQHARTDQNVGLLKTDLQNGLHHVFGDHSRCTEEICNNIGDETQNQITNLKSTTMYNHLNGALDLLIKKAHLLITNENNNRAERLMNIVARFNMGKHLNLIQRGSYERRVYLSGLRYNKKFNWHSNPWKNITGQSPGNHFKKFIERNNNSSERKARKRLLSDPNAASKSAIKKKKEVTCNNKDYGPKAEQPEEDLAFISDELKRLLEKLTVNVAERTRIANESVGQFGNKLYESERQYRLTVSLFGSVVKRRAYTPCHNLVKSCLVNSHFWSEATEYGIAKENVAIRLFEEKMHLLVEKSGLWIDLQHGFLGASPDGLIGEDCIIEVKSLYCAAKLNVNTIQEIIDLKKNICLLKLDGEIKLKKNHSYYYQVQGQLNITGRSKCYFVVYVNDKVDLFIEEIHRDVQLWENKMLPKLKQFYEQCIAPEIIRNNIGNGKKCVDPPYIIEAIRAREELLEKNEKNDNISINK